MRRQPQPADEVVDARVFEQLMNDELPRVWRVVWRILRHQQDTEDVVQDVFIAAHRGMASFRGDARLSTWLHRIAVNTALNHRVRAAERLRRASQPLEDVVRQGSGTRSGTGPASLVATGATPLQALELKELRARLAVCMEKLPTAWRAVVALRDGESLSYQEVAAALDTALGTVRSRLSRARLSLRRCVEGNPT